MNRRKLFIALALTLFAALPVFAQQATVYRVGWLSADRPGGGSPFFDAFREGLRDLGYVEGRNLRIDARWGAESNERLDQLASELVINVKTAKALGIAIPQSILVRANRVIE